MIGHTCDTNSALFALDKQCFNGRAVEVCGLVRSDCQTNLLLAHLEGGGEGGEGGMPS